jgi:hypothetical protein
VDERLFIGPMGVLTHFTTCHDVGRGNRHILDHVFHHYEIAIFRAEKFVQHEVIQCQAEFGMSR